jgi:GNAT superfamily N-acetyltransferase
MALATWWRGDPVAALRPLPEFTVRLETDDAALAALNRISLDEVWGRRTGGHRPYVGYIDGAPVTYGWAAASSAEIGELRLRFALPDDTRYLWDFATLPAWQGRGLYPRLLQAIIAAEGAARYWIIHAPENVPSGAGMRKAGFEAVGQLSFLPDGSAGLLPFDAAERGAAGAALLGVPLLDGGLSPCWRCVDAVVCTCQLDPESCSCAVPTHGQPASAVTECEGAHA